MMTTGRRRLTQPLESGTVIFGAPLLLIIAGTAVAGLLQGFAQHQLLSTMVASGTNFYSLLLTVPFHTLLPVSALAGAGLLTFARITRLGADMDDEIKATV